MSEKDVCPNCGNRYKGVATHWAKSSKCDYPDITPRQREILDGLLLAGAGGFIREDKGAQPKFVMHLTNRDLLEWLANQFGVRSKPVREAATAEETEQQLAGLREASGRGDGDFAYNTDTLYRWETRTNPNFERIRADWQDHHGDRRIPSGLDPSPLTFAVVYAIRGYLDTHNTEADEQVVAFYLAGKAVGTTADWMTLFSSFNPAIWGSEDRLILRDSEAFVQHIKAVDDSPLPTLPHCLRDESLLDETGEDGVECPTCGSTFQNLERHWTGSDCTPPSGA